MKCAICGITVDSMEEAIDQGWEPYFYEGEREHEFACPIVQRYSFRWMRTEKWR